VNWPQWIGSPLQAGSLAILVAIFGLVVRWQLGLRKLKIEAAAVEITAQQVHDADEADIRDHYAHEVEQLRDRLDRQSVRHRDELAEKERRHRAERKEDEDRHRACLRDNDELRDKLHAVKDLAAGLQRIITQASASKAILIAGHAPGEIPEEIRLAAERVELLFMPESGGGDSAPPA
jgi:hypothetical protein